MLHADDGTLHAYLDGELSALEVARLEAHLADCAPCRARLDEERNVITRASRILAMAQPPERAAPPLHQLRHPRLAWRLRVPLAWAASAVIVVAAGWFAFSTLGGSDAAAPASLETERERKVLAYSASAETTARASLVRDSMAALAARAQQSADTTGPAAAATLAAEQPQPRDSAPIAAAAANVAVDGARTDTTAADRDAFAAMAQRGLSDTPAAGRVALRGNVPGVAAAPPGVPAPAPAALYRAARTATDEIPLDSARTLLGGEIHAIDGVAIAAVRRVPGAVIVEQEVAPGVLVALRHESLRPGRATLSTRSGPEQIVGRVTDAESGTPIPNAQVVIRGTSRASVTDQAGAFTFDSVPPGMHSVQARMLGYDPYALAAPVESGRTTVVDFALPQATVLLEAVTVTAAEGRARREAAAPQEQAARAPDLVRRAGRVRISIAGPLRPDSLARLLEKVKPVH